MWMINGAPNWGTQCVRPAWAPNVGDQLGHPTWSINGAPNRASKLGRQRGQSREAPNVDNGSGHPGGAPKGAINMGTHWGNPKGVINGAPNGAPKMGRQHGQSREAPNVGTQRGSSTEAPSMSTQDGTQYRHPKGESTGLPNTGTQDSTQRGHPTQVINTRTQRGQTTEAPKEVITTSTHQGHPTWAPNTATPSRGWWVPRPLQTGTHGRTGTRHRSKSFPMGDSPVVAPREQRGHPKPRRAPDGHRGRRAPTREARLADAVVAADAVLAHAVDAGVAGAVVGVHLAVDAWHPRVAGSQHPTRRGAGHHQAPRWAPAGAGSCPVLGWDVVAPSE